MIILILKISIILIVFLYVNHILFLLYGTRKLADKTVQTVQPPVSVIIAARNEAKNLPECLASLDRLNYPRDKLEIILVDDQSNDATASIIQSFIKDKSCFQYHLNRQKDNSLTGKVNAVVAGIQHSQGKILLFTDADCIVPPNWIQTYLSYFGKEVGLVTAITVLDSPDTAGPFWGKVQSLDWIYLLGIGVSAARNGIPLSCVGNNFALRRCVYEEIGGFARLGFSVTEDFALLNEILTKTKWTVRFTFNKNLVVTSKPVLNLKELFHQRKRWATGSKFVRFFGKLLIIIGGLAHLLLPASLFFTGLIPLGLGGLVFIGLADFIFLLRITSLINRKDLLKLFPLFEIYYFLYTSVYALILLINQKVHWKGVVYDLRTGQQEMVD